MDRTPLKEIHSNRYEDLGENANQGSPLNNPNQSLLRLFDPIHSTTVSKSTINQSINDKQLYYEDNSTNTSSTDTAIDCTSNKSFTRTANEISSDDSELIHFNNTINEILIEPEIVPTSNSAEQEQQKEEDCLHVGSEETLNSGVPSLQVSKSSTASPLNENDLNDTLINDLTKSFGEDQLTITNKGEISNNSHHNNNSEIIKEIIALEEKIDENYQEEKVTDENVSNSDLCKSVNINLIESCNEIPIIVTKEEESANVNKHNNSSKTIEEVISLEQNVEENHQKEIITDENTSNSDFHESVDISSTEYCKEKSISETEKEEFVNQNKQNNNSEISQEVIVLEQKIDENYQETITDADTSSSDCHKSEDYNLINSCQDNTISLTEKQQAADNNRYITISSITEAANIIEKAETTINNINNSSFEKSENNSDSDINKSIEETDGTKQGEEIAYFLAEEVEANCSNLQNNNSEATRENISLERKSEENCPTSDVHESLEISVTKPKTEIANFVSENLDTSNNNKQNNNSYIVEDQLTVTDKEEISNNSHHNNNSEIIEEIIAEKEVVEQKIENNKPKEFSTPEKLMSNNISEYVQAKSPEMMQLKMSTMQEEVTDLRLQVNAGQQIQAQLELKLRQKDEVVIKMQNEIQHQKAEIEQLKLKLEQRTIDADKIDHVKNLEDTITMLRSNNNKLSTEISEKQHNEVKLKASVDEYKELAIRLEESLDKLKEELEIVKRYLANTESAFSDVHEKYERTKDVLEGFKATESSLMEKVTDSEKCNLNWREKYEALKSHAMTQIECANKELTCMRKKYDHDFLKQSGQIKRLVIELNSVQHLLDQKVNECSQLSALLNELTGSN